jgi:O-antigen ligase
MDTKLNSVNWKLENIVFLLVIFLSCCFQLASTIDYLLVPRFLVLGFGLLVLTLVIFLRRQNFTLQLDIVNASFIAYFISHLISIFWAPAKSEAIFYTEKVFLSLILFLLASFLFHYSEQLLLNTCKILVFVAIIYLFVAFSQILKLSSFSYDSMYNVNSLSGHKNLFASFLFLVSIFFVFGSLHSSKLWKYIFGGLAMICFGFILLLQTRAVWLGLIVAISSAIVFVSLKWLKSGLKLNYKAVLIGIITLLCLVGIIIFVLYQTNSLDSFLSRINVFNFSKSASGIERLAVWDKTWSLIKENFCFGVGAGNWQVKYPKFSISGISEALEGATFQRPHNDFLWIFSETGIFGLISFLLLFSIPIAISIHTFLKVPFSNTSVSKLLIACFLIGFLVISFFDFPKERIELLVLSFLLLAYLHTEDFKSTSKFLQVKSNYPLLILIPLLAFCIITGFYRLSGEKAVIKIYKAKNSQNPDGMIRNADKAMSIFYEIDPASMPIHWYKGIGFTQQNNYEKGYEEFRKAYEISKYNHIVNNNLGVCALRDEKMEEAKKYFEESIRINPVYDEPKLNLFVIYFNEKKYEKALLYAQKADSTLARTKRYLNLIQPLVNIK